MKKLLSLLLILALVLSFGLMSCGDNTDDGDDDEGGGKLPTGDRVLSHSDYLAKADGSKVIIEAYVQATQSWWEKDGVGVISVYLQDNAGGYFAYNLQCTEADAAKLTPGTKIKITGTKSTWDGEVEIMDGTFTFSDETDTFVATPTNVTSLLGTDNLATHMNKLVSFKNLTVAPSTKSGDTAELPFLYKWDGSGKQGDDIYFNLTDGENTVTFVVESYLCGKDTKVYKDVEALEVGDKIDLIGFLYWYNGPQAHVTSVATAKSEGVMTYEDYLNAPAESPVVIEAYVQATQSWWDGKITVYLQDQDGGYFAYNLECTEENAAKLLPGTKIKITGEKAVWDGEVEIMHGTFEFGDANDKFVAPVTDVTAYYGTEDLITFMNRFVSVKGLTVAASTKEGDENKYAFLYKWNGSGVQGDDLYFNLTDGTNVYSFCVESYLCGKDTDVYKAVEALQIGDVVDVEGFLYWYNGAQAHVTSVTVVPATDAE